MRLATVGSSWITESFLDSFLSLPGASLAAVYSRSREKAAAFAKKHGAPVFYDSLEEMAVNPSIDGVYLASPNACHAPQARLFLEKGKHVLCEKPLTLRLSEAEELYSLAEKKGVVFCEAMMSAHHPDLPLLRESLGRIGAIHSASLDFSQLSSKYPAYLAGQRPNVFLPETGGGCLEDLGVYAVYLAYLLFGEPKEIRASALFLDTGADGAGGAFLQYENLLVTLTYSKLAQSRAPSQILGDGGAILLESVSQLDRCEAVFPDGKREPLFPPRGRFELMRREAADFVAYCEGGEALVPAQKAQQASLAVLRMTERIRRSAGGFAF